MNDRRAETASQDGWVSFSDILLTLVCAVLFLRTLATSQDTESAKVRQFEERLRHVEQAAIEIDTSAKAVVTGLREVAVTIGAQTSESTTSKAPESKTKPKPE